MNCFWRMGLWLCLALGLVGCATGPPAGVVPVTEFEVDRYLGTWYEIARLDHRFERGLSRVSAEYSLKENGTIRVLNRGYDAEKGEWSEAEGRAKFRGAETVGSLKVAFFGPFYGGYHIFVLDEDYEHALIAGPSKKYLWILARSPELPEATYDALVAEARALDFSVEDLIRVEHDAVAR